jgi:hypothetical protein
MKKILFVLALMMVVPLFAQEEEFVFSYQQGRLIEPAAWNFVNGEVIREVRGNRLILD